MCVLALTLAPEVTVSLPETVKIGSVSNRISEDIHELYLELDCADQFWLLYWRKEIESFAKEKNY